MNSRRRLRTSACAVGALLALTACEKPTPLVTIVSGGSSVYSEARSWCFEDQDPPECSEHDPKTETLAVRGGETIGIDVAKELAEGGWLIELSDPAAEGEQAQPQRSERQEGHYFSFDAPNLPAEAELVLTVLAVGEAEGEEPRGVWQFRLTAAR